MVSHLTASSRYESPRLGYCCISVWWRWMLLLPSEISSNGGGGVDEHEGAVPTMYIYICIYKLADHNQTKVESYTKLLYNIEQLLWRLIYEREMCDCVCERGECCAKCVCWVRSKVYRKLAKPQIGIDGFYVHRWWTIWSGRGARRLLILFSITVWLCLLGVFAFCVVSPLNVVASSFETLDALRKFSSSRQFWLVLINREEGKALSLEFGRILGLENDWIIVGTVTIGLTAGKLISLCKHFVFMQICLWFVVWTLCKWLSSNQSSTQLGERRSPNLGTISTPSGV